VSPDEPTDVMPGGPDEPTELNSTSDEPTGRIPEGNENPTDVIGEPGSEPTEVRDSPPPTGSATGGNRGIGVLVGAIVASLVLVGAYVAAGGPVGPDKAADPCDARPWTDPQNLEEAAQQFALSAADGAACELGVSREELTRSIADDQARQDFMDEHGFTEPDLEDALRAGLNRAVDDAEDAGVLGGLASAGLRAAIKVMPMSTMIGLLENADSIFSGDLGSLGGLGDALNAITGGLGDLGSGSGDDSLGDLGDALEGALPEGTTDGLDEILPKEDRQQLEDDAKEKLKQKLDDLLGP
jgi:hypothetical protein